jgi:ubiquinone/menaquinone biosynthesis C-methylase UbiE
VPLDAVGARRFYDRIGRLQDTQRFYENPAVRRLIELGDFEQALVVFELGCGTGRLAANLLGSVLPSRARYVAVDVSPVMVRIASQRLSPWIDRAAVKLLEAPALSLPDDDATFDRFLATYVFDLLSPDQARALMDHAARLLAPGGLIALVSLTNGTTTSSRLVCSAWNAIALRWPSLVGGCRPIELQDLVTGPKWRVRHVEVLVRLGVPSEVVIAERNGSAAR